MNELNNIINQITAKDLRELDYGEDMIYGNFTLSHYCEDDVIVLNHSETWEEIVQFLYDDEDQITYEVLNKELFNFYNL